MSDDSDGGGRGRAGSTLATPSDRYRALADLVDGGVVELDGDGRVVAVDGTTLDLVGTSRDDLLGRALADLVTPPSVDRVEAALAAEEPTTVTATVAVGANEVRGELRCRPVDGEGRTVCVLADAESVDPDEAFRADVDEVLGRVSDAFYALDEDFRFTHVNERAEELLRRSEADLLGERLWEVFPEAAEIDEVWDAFHDALETQEPQSYELYFEPLDFWVDATVYPSKTGVSVYFRDATERIERERELEESERRYRTLAEHFPNGVVTLFDDDLRYTLAAGDAFDDLPESPADVEGRTPREVFGDHPGGDVEAALEAALDGETRTIEVAYAGRDWVLRAVPITGEHGDVYGGMTTARDVTERTQREAELERVERQFEATFNNPAAFMGLLDTDGTVKRINETALEFAGIDNEDVAGEKFWQTPWFTHSEEIRAELRDAVERAAEGEYVRSEVTHQSVDGEIAVIDAMIEPVHDGSEVVSLLASGRDITEQKEREQRLQETKSQLETATEAGAVGTWEWDVQENRVVADAAFAGQFGVDPDVAREGAPIERFAEAVHEDDRDRIEAKIGETVESCGEYEAEHRVWNADGDLRWVVARGHVECDEDGSPVTFPGAVTDITERKQTERELEETKRQLETLIELLPVAVFVAEADGRIVKWNEAAEEVWGGEVAESESVAEYERYDGWWADTGEPVDPEEWALARALRGEEVTDPDVIEIEGFDGERRTVLNHGMPIRDDDGEVSRAVVTLIDITERREYQRRLEESEYRYRTLVENFPNGGVGVFDEDLRYTLVDGTMWDDIDPDAADLEGETIHEALPDETVHDVAPIFRGALEGESGSVVSTLGGRTYRVWAVPLRDADGEIAGGQSFALDITDRIERERELEESNERLEQFAYAASHDLQEPLRMVSSYLQLIETRYGDELDEEGHEFLEFAVDGADRMREMIDGLLEYSRVETRGDPLQPVDLDEVLAEARRDLRVRIEETDAEVTAESLPTVEGDRAQLTQVFQNLLRNALEYSGDEPPAVHVSAERGGDEWVVSVSDDGIGIDPDDADRIFEVFESLNTRQDHDGTGIGLALSRRIVERHDGEIWVDSTPGEGARFSFTLPAMGDTDE